MLRLNYSEFYITNVCNLACPDCNRFNNFSFAGHQDWQMYKADYEKWSKILQIEHIGILGGEPLIHPDIETWLEGLITLWPDSHFSIYTNGTVLPNKKNFYDFLKKHKNKVILEINWHDPDDKDKIWDIINNFMEGPITTKIVHGDWANSVWVDCYNAVKDPSWPDCQTFDQFINLPAHIQKECKEVHNFDPKQWEEDSCITEAVDKNSVKITVRPAWNYMTSTVIYNERTGKLALHNSDPKKAMEACAFKPCHHFIKGKLYKCGPVGILPEFIEQFKVDISDQDKNLINSYQPATVDWNNDQLTKFIDNLVNAKPIAQCKLCPEQFTMRKLSLPNKKPKVIKIKSL